MGRSFFSEPVDEEALTLPPFPIGDWQAIANLFADVALGLEHAHSRGILHRDIKPSNLLLDQSNKIWISDFGLAKICDDDDGLTRPGFVVGTPRYMAPEQFQGVWNARSDVYSLGITLYEILTLNPCFPGNDRSETEHLEDIQSVNPVIPKTLARIVAKATESEPNLRYVSAGELADDLLSFANSKRTGSSSSLRHIAKRRRLKTPVRFGFFTLIALLVAYCLGRYTVVDLPEEVQQLYRERRNHSFHGFAIRCETAESSGG